MQVSYLNTYGQLFRFNLYHQAMLGAQQVMLLAYVVLCGGIFWQLFPEGYSWPVFVVCLMLYEVVMVAFYTALIVVYLLLAVSPFRNRASLTTHETTLSDKGLFDRTPYGTHEVYWTAVDKVTRGIGFIMIYVQQHSCYAIPKKAFESPQKAEEFFQFARSRWQANKAF